MMTGEVIGIVRADGRGILFHVERVGERGAYTMSCRVEPNNDAASVALGDCLQFQNNFVRWIPADSCMDPKRLVRLRLAEATESV